MKAMKYIVLILIIMGIALVGGLVLTQKRSQTIIPDAATSSQQTALLSSSIDVQNPTSSATLSAVITTSSVTSAAPTVVATSTATTTKTDVSLSGAVQFSNIMPSQGETVRIDIPEHFTGVTVTFDGKNMPVFTYEGERHALLPIKAQETEGAHAVVVTAVGEKNYSKTIMVRNGNFPVVALGIPAKLDVTPAELVQGLEKENADINALVARVTPRLFFTKGFGLPLADNTKIGSRYGEIRKTGNQVIYHMGVDFEGKEGDSIAAMNDGVVREAQKTRLYGNIVIIDHGEGIYTMYLHLKTILISVGAHVHRGQVIGVMGQTGYATGPHLHLSIKVNGISVDPLKFIKVF